MKPRIVLVGKPAVLNAIIARIDSLSPTPPQTVLSLQTVRSIIEQYREGKKIR